MQLFTRRADGLDQHRFDVHMNVFERLTHTRFYDSGELQALCAAAGLVGYQERRQSAWIVFAVHTLD